MAGRPGRRRVDPGSPLVDLDAVFADDAFVDAIAGQPWGADASRFTSRPVVRVAAGSARGSLFTVDPLTELLESWRQELASAPIPAPPNALRAAAPVQLRRPSRSRALRPALAIAAAIAALLVGAASIGSKDAPRDSPLFALTAVLWPSRAASVASADQVDAILGEARSALDDNRVQDAQLALLRATVELGNVDVVDGKGDRQQKVAAMWVEAAPQGGPAGTQPRESTADTPPTTPGTRSVADNTPMSILAAQAVVGTVGAGQPAGVQLAAPLTAGPQIVPLTAPSLEAALGPGRTASQADTAPPVDGSGVTEIAKPTASADPVVPAVDVPPVADTTSAPPSVAPTPPPPTAPVDPPVQGSAPDPASATEQSAPTPPESGPSVETTAPDGTALSSDTGASIQVDPAATANG